MVGFNPLPAVYCILLTFPKCTWILLGDLLVKSIEVVTAAFQLPADDGVFRTVVIPAQMLCKLFFLHGSSFPVVSPERQKGRKKTGPPPVWGNGPVLIVV